MPSNIDSADSVRPNDFLEHSLLTAWLNASDIGMVVFDDSLRVVMLNVAACSLLDISGLEALNASFIRVLSKLDSTPELIKNLALPDWEGEQLATRTSGARKRSLQLRLRVIRDASGTAFKMMAITDVTAVVEMEKRSQEFRQWQAVNAGVVISDALLPDMPVVYVNTAFEALSGFSFAEMVGRNCRHLQGSDHDQPALESIRRAIRDQTNGYAVLRNYRKDGSIFLNELFVSPIKNDAGIMTHLIGIQHLRAE